MNNDEVPPLPYQLSELGVSEESWQAACTNPMSGGRISDIGMRLGISPRVIRAALNRSRRPEASAPDVTQAGAGILEISQGLSTPTGLRSAGLAAGDNARRWPFIELALVDPNPFWSLVRTEFDTEQVEETIQQLAAAWRRGELATYTLNLRRHPGQPGRFQLIYGHLRLEAARRVGVQVLPGQLYEDVADQAMFRRLVEENEQRCAPSVVSEALQIQYAVEVYNWEFKQLTGLYKRSKRIISQLYDLARAPRPFLEFVHGHQEFARVIALAVKHRLNEIQMAELLQLLHEPGATPGAVWEYLQTLPAPAPGQPRPDPAGRPAKGSSSQAVAARERSNSAHSLEQPAQVVEAEYTTIECSTIIEEEEDEEGGVGAGDRQPTGLENAGNFSSALEFDAAELQDPAGRATVAGPSLRLGQRLQTQAAVRGNGADENSMALTTLRRSGTGLPALASIPARQSQPAGAGAARPVTAGRMAQPADKPVTREPAPAEPGPEEFTRMTGQELELLEQLDLAMRRIETFNSKYGISREFMLKLVQRTLNFTEYTSTGRSSNTP